MDGELKGLEWSLHTNYGYILGTYEPPIILELIKVRSLEKNPVCYDCGANAGHFSILSSILSKSNVIVYAFEPTKEHLSVMNNYITKNIRNSPSLDKIQLFSCNIFNEVKNLSFSNND